MFKVNPLMATEAIAHQDGKLFKELTEAYRTVMSVKSAVINNELIKKAGINRILSEGINGNVTVSVADDSFINAWMMPPYFDASHAVSQLSESYNDPATTKFFIDQQKKHFKGDKFLAGTVDRENAKLGGDFSKVECPIWVTRGLLSHSFSTPETVAWITLHELGHFFTYFEHLGRTNTFNGALLASAEQFFKKDHEKDRIKVIADIGDLVHLNADDKEALMMAKDKEQFILVIARSYIMPRSSQLGSSIYDLTLWESLSDQFANRMAPGKHGVLAMELLYTAGSGNYGGMMSHVIMTLFNVLLFAIMTVLSFGLALIILFIDPSKKIYDAPRARMVRLRNDLVAGLKSRNLTAKQKQALTDDIAQVDAIIAKVEDYRGLIELFYTSILPSGRKEYSQLLFQRQLEQLTTNNLVLASAKLNNLTVKLNA